MSKRPPAIKKTTKKPLTPMERVHAIARLKAEKGYNTTQAAAKLGYDVSTIMRLETLLSLPADIQSLVEEGAVPASTAYAISHWPDIEAQRRLAHAVAAGEMSRADVIEAVHAAVGPKRQPPGASRLAWRDGGLSVTVKADRPMDWDSLLEALTGIMEKARRTRDGWQGVTAMAKPRRPRR